MSDETNKPADHFAPSPFDTFEFSGADVPSQSIEESLAQLMNGGPAATPPPANECASKADDSATPDTVVDESPTETKEAEIAEDDSGQPPVEQSTEPSDVQETNVKAQAQAVDEDFVDDVMIPPPPRAVQSDNEQQSSETKAAKPLPENTPPEDEAQSSEAAVQENIPAVAELPKVNGTDHTVKTVTDADTSDEFVAVRIPIAESSVEDSEPQQTTEKESSPSTTHSEAQKCDTTEVPVADVEETSSENRFENLPLIPEVQTAVAETGYTIPTDIQQQIIPSVLAGRDVLAQSQTGTGKTAAFALPILSRIDVNVRKPQVLVLAPTRELAVQVADSFTKYGKHIAGFSVAAVYGGQGYDAQLRQLRRGVPVVVGTPGRVIDHIKRGTLDLSGIECIVLDEADEMLNMGFLDDVRFVLDQMPEQRQIALFSATLPTPIRNIAKQYQNDPVLITIAKKTMTADSIRQRAVFVAPRDKIDVLSRFLQVEDTDGVIVFMRTREATVSVAEQLTAEGFAAVALNGDMPQAVRERAIAQLKNGKLDILVATDVAARGLDVQRISHVFNYDVPQDNESYIHRIGRTGRAGRSGEAIIFLTNNQRYRLKSIERSTKQPIQVVGRPTADEINNFRVDQFKKKIVEAASCPDMELFSKIIAEVTSETSLSIETVAAAMAHLAQNGRPLLIQDRPRVRREREERRERGGRNDRSRGNDYGDSRGERNERPRRGGPPKPGMDRYRIEVGRRDSVMPGNIVGAIANEAGLDGRDIGPIMIHDAYSTVDLPEGMPPEVHETLQHTWVSGKQLRISKARAEDSAGSFRSRDDRGGRPPRTNNRGGRKNFGNKGPRADKRRRRKQ